MNLLSPFGWLYGRTANVRNVMYDRGILRSHSLGAKTISIGNITVGGTGKTPLVALVAEILAENGEQVCILTRGYGRSDPNQRVLVSDKENVLVNAKTGGDEPVELAHKLLGKALVVADADRVSAAKWAREKFGITAFVLDDGFQHRRARRDLDIVCIDATDSFGGGKLLPAGRLREPIGNLTRADAIVITRANFAKDLKGLRSQISDLNPDAPVFQSENHIVELPSLEEFHARTQSSQRRTERDAAWNRLYGKPGWARLFAFCALGNPDSFFAAISSELDTKAFEKMDLSETKAFPDHHYYSQADIETLEAKARENGIDALITTAKDAVKLKDLKFNVPCYVVEIQNVIDDPDRFRNLIIAS